jgi:hypothetical protein
MIERLWLEIQACCDEAINNFRPVQEKAASVGDMCEGIH